MKPQARGKTHECPEPGCRKTFTRSSAYERHVRTHSRPDRFKCLTCGEVFTQEFQHTEHVRTHVTNKPHMCELCGKSFDEKSALALHTADVHAKNKPGSLISGFQSNASPASGVELQHDKGVDKRVRESTSGDAVSSVETATAEPENVGMLSEREKPHMCDSCGKRFAWQWEVEKHVNEVHEIKKEIGPLTCSTCNREFKNPGSLKMHEKSHKPRESFFVCDFCGLHCRCQASLAIHRRRHTGERPFKCSTCGKGFVDNSTLTGHIYTHTKRMPHVCAQCGKGFVLPSKLQVHMRTHGVKKQFKKQFKCKTCRKRFHSKFYLKEHMTVHTGELPHACAICSMRFSRAEYIRIHMKKVHKRLPYKCGKCSKQFMTKLSISRHMGTHVAVQPFLCNACGAGFLSKDELQIHIKSDHAKIFVCMSCDEVFVKAKDLQIHSERECQGRMEMAKPLEDLASPGAAKQQKAPGNRGGTTEVKKLYFCSVCGETFSTEDDLENHSQEQSETGHQCGGKSGKPQESAVVSFEEDDVSDCETLFIKTLHLCVTCGETFSVKNDLRTHQKQHGNIEPDVHPKRAENTAETSVLQLQTHTQKPKDDRKETPNEGDDQPPKLVCSTCLGVFTTYAYLDMHKCPETKTKVVTQLEDPSERSKKPLPDMVENPFCPTDEKPFCCSICGKSFKLIGNMKKHEARHAGLKPFKCTYCELSFTSAGHLKTHTRLHTKEKPYKCETCGASFCQSSSLLYHKKKKRCPIYWAGDSDDDDNDDNNDDGDNTPGFEDSVENELETQSIASHLQRKTLKVDRESQKGRHVHYPSEQQEDISTVLANHVSNPQEQIYIGIAEPQGTAQLVTSHQQGELQMMQLVAIEEGGVSQIVEMPYYPEEGQPVYMTVETLPVEQGPQETFPQQNFPENTVLIPDNTEQSYHGRLEDIHMEQALPGNIRDAVVCEVVETTDGAAWTGRRARREHIEHAFCPTPEKPYCCPICGKSFRLPGNMRKHEKKHEGLRPFQCEHCDKCFKEAGHLRSHTRLHTNDMPYVCETCGRGFAQGSSLKYHIRKKRCKINLATGEVFEKIYECPECKKVFKKSANLRNHKKHVHREKQHVCPHCEKRFSTRANMRQHVRLHTDERPYECKTCGMTFAQSGRLKYHLDRKKCIIAGPQTEPVPNSASPAIDTTIF